MVCYANAINCFMHCSSENLCCMNNICVRRHIALARKTTATVSLNFFLPFPPSFLILPSQNFFTKASLFAMNKPLFLLLLLLSIVSFSYAQTSYELNNGWQCKIASSVVQTGEQISMPATLLQGWQPAVVPGTVLTTLLANKEIPDPFYGMNNKAIADIYDAGKEKYTYWFVNDFIEQSPTAGGQVWLHFRGVNYGCDVYCNGTKLNVATHKGMFLSQTYNITSLLQTGNNRLAVIVYPPDAVGNPNGGQGGDGTIGKNVTNQYVAGWDWIQPVHDRNTGIWDKVWIEKTGSINIKNIHIATEVPGVRLPTGTQQPATIQVSAELDNAINFPVSGRLFYTLGNDTISKVVTVKAGSSVAVSLPDYTLLNPKLWWPNTYGEPNLYTIKVQFITNTKTVSDVETMTFGVRKIEANWNATTRSREISVNGQKIFIRGGNWIVSDAMLRFSKERYDAEVHFHRDMNLNLIRIWGGGILERPEFYDACDKYGLLVMQDLWGSGDCNGRWMDALKKDDQWTRRQYPDDHALYIASAADGIRMIRNHPSLAIWCGGNEITPPEDIFHSVKDSLLPLLDGTRWFVDYSNSDSISYNFLGGNGDGPYGIQNIKTFFQNRTFPFNSEVGSVGMNDYTSLQRFIPDSNMRVPQFANGRSTVDSVWDYHKYIGYDNSIAAYGNVVIVQDFAKKAQLVNYDQYRGLMEGFTAHEWDWYTGVIIWKTQNPWTAMRGQMYDYFLDPNAGLYGLHTAGEPLHVMFNAADSVVMIANNTFEAKRDVMLQISLCDMKGNSRLLTQVLSEIGPTTVKRMYSIHKEIAEASKDSGLFISLRLLNINKQIISDNLYWLPDASGNYTGLQKMDKTELTISTARKSEGTIAVTLSNSVGKPVAFFNRISLINTSTKQRILPSFYSDNYVSVLPGESKTITIDYKPVDNTTVAVDVEGWNVDDKITTIE